jgi:quercetin dioxygenase-like cupin family protein
MERMHRSTRSKFAGAVLAAVATLLTLGAGAAEIDTGTMSVTRPEEIKWQNYLPMPGIKIAVISGNPREAGPYTIRVWFSPNTMTRPHSHPEARQITVIKGTWWAGAGEKFDPEAAVELPTGSVIVHHPNKFHYDGAKAEEAIVQISGVGPSGTSFANPADDPDNKKSK